MENTTENKAKFFAQYWMQEIFGLHDHEWKRMGGGLLEVNQYKIQPELVDVGYLELKPLSQITDEDVIELAEIFGFIPLEHTAEERKKIVLVAYPRHFNKHQKAVDFLRGKGYALDWSDVSVEKQIEWGWVKLKNQD